MERLARTFSTLMNESPSRFIKSLDNFKDIYGSSPDDSEIVEPESEEKIKHSIAAIPLPKIIVQQQDTSIDQPLPDHVLRKQHDQLVELLDHERSLIKKCEVNIAAVNACIERMDGAVANEVPAIVRAKNVGNDFKMHRTIFKSLIERLFPKHNKEIIVILSDLVECNFENKYVRVPVNTTPALLDALHRADLIETHPERDNQIKLKKL